MTYTITRTDPEVFHTDAPQVETDELWIKKITRWDYYVLDIPSTRSGWNILEFAEWRKEHGIEAAQSDIQYNLNNPRYSSNQLGGKALGMVVLGGYYCQVLSYLLWGSMRFKITKGGGMARILDAKGKTHHLQNSLLSSQAKNLEDIFDWLQSLTVIAIASYYKGQGNSNFKTPLGAAYAIINAKKQDLAQDIWKAIYDLQLDYEKPERPMLL